VSTPLTPVLSRFWDADSAWTLETYERHHGYRALRKALAMTPDQVINLVKESGCAGAAAPGSPPAPSGRSSRRTSPIPNPTTW